MLNLRLRDVIRNAVVGEAELRSGHLPGAQPVTVGFVDIVGFTQLGEEIPPDELGAVVREFERTVEDAVQPPVRLVKTIGDAAMLASPGATPVSTRWSASSRFARATRTARCCAAASPRARRCSARATSTAARSTSRRG